MEIDAAFPDPRFFERAAALSLETVARLVGAELVDGEPGRGVRRVAPLARADGDDIGFLADRRYAGALATTRAGAVLVSAQDAELAPAGCARLITNEPLAAYVLVADRLHRPRRRAPGSAAIDPAASIEVGAELGSGVVVGAGARVGSGTTIGANAVVGPGVAIGRDCSIGPNVVIGFALIGDRVRILAGAAIGEEGFGVATTRSGPVDVPQLGRVILQDGVTIGANACVDRGAWDDTIVGENTKIDNLVHVAHNVVLGRNCRLAAFTGLSGSVTVGDDVVFGGRAGVVDHIVIGARASIAAASVVTKDVPAGAIWGGSPARPVARWMRETAWVSYRVRKGARP